MSTTQQETIGINHNKTSTNTGLVLPRENQISTSLNVDAAPFIATKELQQQLQTEVNSNLQKLNLEESRQCQNNLNSSDESEDESKIGLENDVDGSLEFKLSESINREMSASEDTLHGFSLPETNKNRIEAEGDCTNVLNLDDAFDFNATECRDNHNLTSNTSKSQRYNPFDNSSQPSPQVNYINKDSITGSSNLEYQKHDSLLSESPTQASSSKNNFNDQDVEYHNPQFKLMADRVKNSHCEPKLNSQIPSPSFLNSDSNAPTSPWVKLPNKSNDISLSESPLPTHDNSGKDKCISSPENIRTKKDYKEKPESMPVVDGSTTLDNEHNKPNVYNEGMAISNAATASEVIYVAGPCEPEDLIEGIIFTANYLGSTQLMAEKNPAKSSRMLQAQEAVSRIKAPDGETQPSVEVDLFISTSKVKVLNADTQETMMEHFLRSISYIADIGELLVIMAKRRPPGAEQDDNDMIRVPKQEKRNRIICHVFSSSDAHLMAQAIGQAFNVAYQQFLRANGIEPQTLTQEDFNTILDTQDMYHDDLVHYSKQENIKELWIEKQKGEVMGIVVVESGWGSILPTVVLANMQHGSPVERNGKLSIGDQIMAINSTSLVGLPLQTCHSIIKGLKNHTLVKMNIVSCPPVVTVLVKRPDLKYQLGFSVQNGIICSLMRGGIAERGGVRVGHRIIEINSQSVVATPHDKIVQMLVTSVGEIQMKTMPAAMYRLLTGQEQPVYI